MKPRLLRRATALLWALTFLLGTAGEGFGLHPCPHHGGGAPEAHAPGGGHDGHDGAEAHHGQGAEVPGDSHSGPCTCGSVCQAGAGTALPGQPSDAPADAVEVESSSGTAAAESPVLGRPPYFLPFSQAPPRQG